MAEEVKSFIGQRMNLDVDERLLKPEETREVYNAIADISGTLLKFSGNVKLEYQLPLGENRVMTTCNDHARNAVIYFVWNSLGRHSILRYRPSKIDRIVWSSSVLNFQWDKPVNHCFVLGDLLFWTDGYDVGFERTQNNPPRSINFIKAIGTNHSWGNVVYQKHDVVNFNGRVYEYINESPASKPVSDELYWTIKGLTYDWYTEEKMYRILDRIKYPSIAQVPTVIYTDI